MILTQLLYNKVDLTMVLNGALSGLAAIIAGPNYPSMGTAILIDGIGGALVVYAVPMFDKLKIDDTVGALSVPLVNGIRVMFAVRNIQARCCVGGSNYWNSVRWGFCFRN